MGKREDKPIALPNSKRIAMPSNAGELGMTRPQWETLVGTIFPGAQSPEAVIMAWNYCQQRNLDVFKKVVHIVPMYNSSIGREVETVWPGIAEVRITAHRTGKYAGIDATDFGPVKTCKFSGKNAAGYAKSCEEITFPEYAQCTVYKMIEGVRCAFVGPKVVWTEIFSGLAGTRVPNTRWQENAFQMVEKCAEAAALRRAFPEELGDTYTFEEMEGKTISSGGAVIDIEGKAVDTSSNATEKAVDGDGEPASFNEAEFRQNFLAQVKICATLTEFKKGMAHLDAHKTKLSTETFNDLVEKIDKARDDWENPPEKTEKELSVSEQIIAALSECGTSPSAIRQLQGTYAIEIENLPTKERSDIEDKISVALDEAWRVTRPEEADKAPAETEATTETDDEKEQETISNEQETTD